MPSPPSTTNLTKRSRKARGMSETPIVKEIQIQGCKIGLKLFRNNVGNFELSDGRRVQVGLCPGSSDLIGWKPIVITQKMVGNKIAVFVALEVKKPGSRTDKDRLILQGNFIEVVKADGGIAGFVNSAEDAARIVDE